MCIVAEALCDLTQVCTRPLIEEDDGLDRAVCRDPIARAADFFLCARSAERSGARSRNLVSIPP